MIRSRAMLAALAVCLSAVFAAPLVSHAGDEEKKKTAPHLDYRKTYEEALLEARIRNLPVFISRHKDFWGRCTRQYRSVLTNKKFIKYAKDKLVVLIVHNERGHDSIEGKDYDGKPVFLCPLYPGLTCQQHCDAAVDVDGPRDEFLVKVPFITLCPNSWLVPPTGEPVQISEEDQFVAGKVQKAVDAMQKPLGASLPAADYLKARNALDSFDHDLEDEAYGKALRSLAGLESIVKKPHAALMDLVDARLGEVEEQIRWAYEDAIEVGAKDDTPFSVRVETVRALEKVASQSIYGKHLPVLAEMRAWLKDKAIRTGK